MTEKKLNGESLLFGRHFLSWGHHGERLLGCSIIVICLFQAPTFGAGGQSDARSFVSRIRNVSSIIAASIIDSASMLSLESDLAFYATRDTLRHGDLVSAELHRKAQIKYRIRKYLKDDFIISYNLFSDTTRGQSATHQALQIVYGSPAGFIMPVISILDTDTLSSLVAASISKDHTDSLFSSPADRGEEGDPMESDTSADVNNRENVYTPSVDDLVKITNGACNQRINTIIGNESDSDVNHLQTVADLLWITNGVLESNFVTMYEEGPAQRQDVDDLTMITDGSIVLHPTPIAELVVYSQTNQPLTVEELTMITSGTFEMKSMGANRDSENPREHKPQTVDDLELITNHQHESIP